MRQSSNRVLYSDGKRQITWMVLIDVTFNEKGQTQKRVHMASFHLYGTQGRGYNSKYL